MANSPETVSADGRLDQYLVREGLARSRTLAQRLIHNGAVRVADRVITKASYAVAPGQQVTVTEAADSRWVGRGALKLVHALSAWGEPSGSEEHMLHVRGRRCLDVGASTGGFTQVLLEHGAAHVTALDVGRDQLAPDLAADERVTDLPGTNIRDVTRDQLGTFELVVGDVSFISLRLVLPAVAPLVEPRGDVLFLVKPQFEVGREHLGHGGVVTSSQERVRALQQVVQTATGLGWLVHGLDRSPVTGTHGNIEYLLWLAAYQPGMMSAGVLAARIRDLTREDD
ncbi:TlyA family RNA methyltransferase [Ornithinimicrobium murale]|uniref:TlyA family RNA methyltransferase n=1 Tax=Ornithinimicrobium murale TaxID=1050153 RepID=UPI001EDD22A3|nr:TlyA family RNA methyltransferase [Ornithinimicrobium murale]